MTEVDIDRIVNATAYDPNGDKLGKVGDIFLDDQTGDPTFLTVKTGKSGNSETLVPVSGHTWDGDDLVLPYEKDVIKDAPDMDADQQLSEQEQDDLFAYYEGLKSDTSGDAEEGEGTTLTRSEERLNVGTETVKTGRARLRKHTITENQSVTVPVTKERVAVERTPIEGDVEGTIDEDEVVEEITTHEERPVVDKETVQVEKVSLGKETETEKETVSRDLRKEQIDIDEDADDSRS